MEVVSEEMWHIYNWEEFSPVDGKNITKENKEKGLDSLILIKKKRDRKLKGRACAGRWKKRRGFTKEEDAPPMSELE